MQIRKIIFIIAFWTVGTFPFSVYGQSADSIEVWTSYYPLNVGDKWEYNGLSDGGEPRPDDVLHRLIPSDSLMTNGFRYSLVEEGDCTGYCKKVYERIDTTTMTVMRYGPDVPAPDHFVDEYPVYLLPNGKDRREKDYGEIADYYRMSCGWIQPREVFGQLTRIWRCDRRDIKATHVVEIEFAEDIGPVFFGDIWNHGPYEWYWINYVQVSTNEAGIRVNSEGVDTAGLSHLELFPNPVTPGSSIGIEGRDLITCSEVDIVDVIGRRHYANLSQLTQTRAEIIPAQRLTSGVYFGKLRCRQAIRAFNFIVLSN